MKIISGLVCGLSLLVATPMFAAQFKVDVGPVYQGSEFSLTCPNGNSDHWGLDDSGMESDNPYFIVIVPYWGSDEKCYVQWGDDQQLFIQPANYSQPYEGNIEVSLGGDDTQGVRPAIRCNTTNCYSDPLDVSSAFIQTSYPYNLFVEFHIGVETTV